MEGLGEGLSEGLSEGLKIGNRILKNSMKPQMSFKIISPNYFRAYLTLYICILDHRKL